SAPSAAGAYNVVSEGLTIKQTNSKDMLLVLQSNHAAKHVFGHGDPNNAVRVWPLDSYERGVELRATSDEHVATVAWRPGTAEVGVPSSTVTGWSSGTRTAHAAQSRSRPLRPLRTGPPHLPFAWM